MTQVYMTSDWHLNHRNIPKFRDVESVEENTKRLVEGYLATITKRDIVYFLGDIAFDHEGLEVVKSLPGDKRLILGNHDTDRKVDIADLMLVYDQIHGIFDYKASWLSHAPIHPQELRGKLNIHGHMHNEHIKDRRYVNVCVDNTNMRPITYTSILNGWRGTTYE